MSKITLPLNSKDLENSILKKIKIIEQKVNNFNHIDHDLETTDFGANLFYHFTLFFDYKNKEHDSIINKLGGIARKSNDNSISSHLDMLTNRYNNKNIIEIEKKAFGSIRKKAFDSIMESGSNSIIINEYPYLIQNENNEFEDVYKTIIGSIIKDYVYKNRKGILVHGKGVKIVKKNGDIIKSADVLEHSNHSLALIFDRLKLNTNLIKEHGLMQKDFVSGVYMYDALFLFATDSKGQFLNTFENDWILDVSGGIHSFLKQPSPLSEYTDSIKTNCHQGGSFNSHRADAEKKIYKYFKEILLNNPDLKCVDVTYKVPTLSKQYVQQNSYLQNIIEIQKKGIIITKFLKHNNITGSSALLCLLRITECDVVPKIV
jgi:hypothetical protein